MKTQRAVHVSLLMGAMAMALALPALAQTGTASTLTAPDYSGAVASNNFASPAAEGRPGVYFFDIGAYAFNHGNYRHALYMYKLAAFWGYHPAEYNLGIMYYKGQGVAVDHARGAAWMILAARNGSARFARAQDLMVTALTPAEFKRTDTIWNQLKPKYGNKVTLRRAEQKWHRVKTTMTGSHLGHAVGELLVGHGGAGTPTRHVTTVATTAAGAFGDNNTVDGAVAYRQFTESRNPYAPIFLKYRTGKATVEPLQQIAPTQKADKAGAKTKQPDSQSGHQPQNA